MWHRQPVLLMEGKFSPAACPWPLRRRLTIATALGLVGHHHHLGASHLGLDAPGPL